jgi:hypothetical protein
MIGVPVALYSLGLYLSLLSTEGKVNGTGGALLMVFIGYLLNVSKTLNWPLFLGLWSLTFLLGSRSGFVSGELLTSPEERNRILRRGTIAMLSALVIWIALDRASDRAPLKPGVQVEWLEYLPASNSLRAVLSDPGSSWDPIQRDTHQRTREYSLRDGAVTTLYSRGTEYLGGTDDNRYSLFGSNYHFSGLSGIPYVFLRDEQTGKTVVQIFGSHYDFSLRPNGNLKMVIEAADATKTPVTYFREWVIGSGPRQIATIDGRLHHHFMWESQGMIYARTAKEACWIDFATGARRKTVMDNLSYVCSTALGMVVGSYSYREEAETVREYALLKDSQTLEPLPWLGSIQLFLGKTSDGRLVGLRREDPPGKKLASMAIVLIHLETREIQVAAQFESVPVMDFRVSLDGTGDFLLLGTRTDKFRLYLISLKTFEKKELTSAVAATPWRITPVGEGAFAWVQDGKLCYVNGLTGEQRILAAFPRKNEDSVLLNLGKQ